MPTWLVNLNSEWRQIQLLWEHSFQTYRTTDLVSHVIAFFTDGCDDQGDAEYMFEACINGKRFSSFLGTPFIPNKAICSER